MPGTFVLSGVRSPRTTASFVTCSILPPSHAFQFRVRVSTRAAASKRTATGVTYLSHGQWVLGCADGLPACSVVSTGLCAGALAATIFLLLPRAGLGYDQ